MQKVDLKALRDAAQVLDETYAGRAAGRQERIETIRQQTAENHDWHTLLTLLQHTANTGKKPRILPIPTPKDALKRTKRTFR